MEPSICVLGGGGFLGSHLVEALLVRGARRLRVVDRDLRKLETESSRIERVEADVEEPGVLEAALDNADVIVSTTALCNPSLYNTRPVEVIHANFTHLVPLVERCARQGKRLVHFSTCEVYGREHPDSPPGGAGPMQEDATPLVYGPIGRERWTYACAKQLLERLIWACGRHHGLAFTIVRPFNVIGPRMDYIPGVDGEGIPRVLARFMRALLFDEPLPLVDGGTSRRTFVYVDDFIEAVVRVIGRPDACRGQVLNLGNPHNEIGIAELAELMRRAYREVTGREAAARPEPIDAESFYGPGYDDTARRVPDIDKARRLLDWEPSWSIERMLPVIVRDYLEHYRPRRTRP